MTDWLRKIDDLAGELKSTERISGVLTKPTKPVATVQLQTVKPAIDEIQQVVVEVRDNPTIDSMRATQPPGWGWWGYELADGGRGSLRGPYPDRPTALAALQHEFDQKVVRFGPLDGSKPLVDILDAQKVQKVEIGNCAPPEITCQICLHWTADQQNPSGGMGKCRRGFKVMAFPWHKCRGISQ